MIKLFFFFLLGMAPQMASTQEEYLKLSFPSSSLIKFIPWVIGVDHNLPVSTKRTKCLNYQSKKYFPYCYAGHKGSDWMLAGGFAAMHLGVSVRSAAAGKVVHVEDGHGDHCFANPFTRHPSKISCLDNPTRSPNYVTVRQADGLIAFYYHLRKNSTRVLVGDEVGCGKLLGEVGSSGISSSPHIHFELRKLNPGAVPKNFTYGEVLRVSKTIDPYALNLWKGLKGKRPLYLCQPQDAFLQGSLF